jgi:peroxiredoxin Q/BCP
MVNKPVADFSLPATGSGSFRLSEIFSAGGPKVKSLVLYFYPKDNTPGCTIEGQNFRDLHAQFLKAGALVFGVSRDSLKSHENFKAKMAFPFDLISDPDEKACSLFGVMKMKNMYGRQVRGIERSTFVLDRSRAVRREWRGVKVPGHAQEVLDFVKTV